MPPCGHGLKLSLKQFLLFLKTLIVTLSLSRGKESNNGGTLEIEMYNNTFNAIDMRIPQNKITHLTYLSPFSKPHKL